jgi:hypothetical protein
MLRVSGLTAVEGELLRSWTTAAGDSGGFSTGVEGTVSEIVIGMYLPRFIKWA